MNKKLTTLAVAAAMAAPLSALAETTLYGRIDISLRNDDIDSVTITDGVAGTPSKSKDGWDVRNESTRIGVKGSEDLGGGLKAIFQAEWAFEGAEGGSTYKGTDVFANRLAYAGLSGNWGTVAAGRQWTPYYAINKADIYNFGDVNPQFLGTSRTGNAIQYKLPNFNGFSGAAMLTFDGSNNIGTDNNRGIDQYNLNLTYDNGPVSVAVGYLRDKGTGGFADYKMAGIGGSYVFNDMFKIIAQYESGSSPLSSSGDDFDISEWTIAGEGYWGNNVFRASYADYGRDADGNIWGLGWQYNFSKRTRVYVEYLNGEAISRSAITTNAMDQLVIPVSDGSSGGIGIRHYF